MSQVNPHFPLSLLAMAVGIALSASLYADEKPHNITLKELTVTATHGEQDVLKVANTVSVITEEDIQKQQSANVKDLLRYESGVSVRAQPMRAGAALSGVGRGGNEGINIRGLEGNQVIIQTDGVRLPAYYSFGPTVSGRGDYLEPEGYRRVEILRGPSSTLYGSEGLAGAVSFVTKDPEDLLTLGKDVQFNLRAGYASEDRSWFSTPSFAARNDHLAGMLLYTVRDGEQLRNQGSNDVMGSLRTKPNPQSKESEYWLAKLVWDVSEEHQLKFTAEKLDRKVDTNVLTGISSSTRPNMVGGVPVSVTRTDVTGLSANDRVARELFKLDYVYEPAQPSWIDLARFNIYHQDSTNTQFTDERRTITTTPPGIPSRSDRIRDNEYSEKLHGFGLVLGSSFGSDIEHRLHYGVDYSTAAVKSVRSGTLPPAGERFPYSPFPKTDYQLLGAFIQDEVVLGRLSVIPGLRFDHYKLKPSTYDPLYSGEALSSLSDSAVSGKFGLVWHQTDLLNLFAQYSEGFRAPTPSNVYEGFENLAGFQPYKVIGNLDLKPETSKMFELGVRGRSEDFRYHVSVYRSNYTDFINERATVGGNGTVLNPTINQSINNEKAVITGVEGSARWKLDPLWAVSTGFAWNRGNTIDDGLKTPLRTIDPAKITAGLHYDQGHYYGDLMLTHVQAQKRNPNPNGYTPGSFTTLDLMAGWNLLPNASIQAGIFNITDESYTHWADVRELGKASQIVDAFTQPGRNFKVSFNYQF